MGYLYILLSFKNNSYYIGSTDNVERRTKEHTQGKSKYTRHLRPLKVVFIQECKSLKEARRLETKLKRYKSRSIIEQIIKDGFIKTRR